MSELNDANVNEPEVNEPEVNQEGDVSGQNQNEKNDKKDVKQFTQEQLNAMMTREKRTGENVILKSLGLNSKEELDAVKEIIKKHKEDEEKNKTDLEKEKEKTTKLEQEKAAAIKEKDDIVAKYEAIKSGVNPDYVDDILVIAKSKKKDDEKISDVIKEMKEDEKYSYFFGEKQKEGTGSGKKSTTQKTNSIGDYGKRLAERKKHENYEDVFFKN